MTSEEFNHWGERIARVRAELEALGRVDVSELRPRKIAQAVRQAQKAAEYLLLVMGQVFTDAQRKIERFGDLRSEFKQCS